MPRLWRECGPRVSPNTLKRFAPSWKLTCYSLKHQRDPAAFAACQQQLAALHRAEQQGHLVVYYVDEVHFSR